MRLSAYSGQASDLPPHVLQDYLDAVAAGTMSVPVAQVFRMDQIAEAHSVMEAGTATGKLVVTT